MQSKAFKGKHAKTLHSSIRKRHHNSSQDLIGISVEMCGLNSQVSWLFSPETPLLAFTP